MTERLEVLFSLIGNGETFADVGCDHGYISKAVLDRGNYKKVIISDISALSLEKAKELLKDYGDRVTAVCSDGFNGYTTVPCEAFIAGMGGEEIVSILSSAVNLPNKLTLAPQKNTDKVRRFLVDKGYKILKDFTFYSSGKFYDAISAVKGKDGYTENEFLFGRDNLKEMPSGFKLKLERDIKTLQDVIKNPNASQLNKDLASEKLIKIKEILK